MKAIYEFEENLLKEYDFEPRQDGYNIDDLSERDRHELAGMLYCFYNALCVFENEKFENEQEGLLGKLRQEYLDKFLDIFETCCISDICQFVISCLDSYET